MLNPGADWAEVSGVSWSQMSADGSIASTSRSSRRGIRPCDFTPSPKTPAVAVQSL